MTYVSHCSVYGLFVWEIINQKIELPHASLTLASIFCYTGLQLIIRSVNFPLIDRALSSDFAYLVIDGGFLFVILNLMFYVDLRTRKERLGLIYETK
jgi:hypothetical protein